MLRPMVVNVEYMVTNHCSVFNVYGLILSGSSCIGSVPQQRGGKMVYKAVHFAGYIGILSAMKPVSLLQLHIHTCLFF